MEGAQPSPTLTLDDVHRHFQHWRDNRAYQTERIPDALLTEARSLLDRYSLSDVMGRIGINRHRLLPETSTPLEPTTAKSEETKNSTPFVQVSLPPPETTIPCLEIEHTNGTKLRLQNCGDALAVQMVSTFMEHRSCCK